MKDIDAPFPTKKLLDSRKVATRFPRYVHPEKAHLCIVSENT